MKWTWDKFGYVDDGNSDEYSLLACLLLNPALCDVISGVVEPDDFLDSRNRILFHHLLAMRKATGTFDVVSLMSALRESGDYENVGGITRLVSLIRRSVVANSEHAEYYAKMIHGGDSHTDTEPAK